MKSCVVRLAALLAITAASVGPAAAQGGAHGPDRPPPGCTWSRAERPARPPKPEEARRAALQDSIEALILADLRGAPRSGPGPVAQGLAIVTTDRRRTAATVRLFRSNLADSVAAAVAARALPALQRWPGSGAVTTALRLDTLPPAPAATRPYDCDPAIQDRELVGRLASRYVQQEQQRGAMPARSLTTRVRLVVTRDGEVAHADLARSSGTLSFDEFVLHTVSTLRFRPSVSRGVPRDSFVNFPFAMVAETQ